MARERNWAVWVLIVLAVLDGILDLVNAARLLGWLPGEALVVIPFIPIWLGALGYAAIAVLWFIVAKWLYDFGEVGTPVWVQA